MGESVQTFPIMPVKGVNLDLPPEKLPPDFTDDSLNVFNTPEKIQKRGGIKNMYAYPQIIPDVKFRAIIEDMVFYSGIDTVNNIALPETIFVSTVYDDLLPGVPPALIPNKTSGWFVQILNQVPQGWGILYLQNMQLGTTGQQFNWDRSSEFIPADNEIVWKFGSDPYYVRLFPNASQWDIDYGTPRWQSRYRTGMWHKSYFWFLGAPDTSYAEKVRSIWGSTTVFPSDQYVRINSLGRNRHTTGCFSFGDIAYIFQSDAIHMLSGSTNLAFRLEKVRTSYGAYGSRSAVNAKGFLVVPLIKDIDSPTNINSGTDMFYSDYRRHCMVDIGVIAGTDSETIGAPIRKFLLDNGAYTGERTRSAYLPSNSMYYLLLKTSQVKTQTSDVDEEQIMLIRNFETQAWWNWKFTERQKLTTMRSFLDSIWFGSNCGNIAKIDDTQPYDEVGVQGDILTDYKQIPIPAYITTSWLSVPTRDRSDYVEWTKIYGNQASGGTAELWVAKNFGDYYKIADFELKRDGVRIPIRMNAEHIKLKIVFPLDGAECSILDWTLAVRQGAY